MLLQKAVYHLDEPEEPHPTPRVTLLLLLKISFITYSLIDGGMMVV